jgi:hypothetical protein
VRHFALTAGGPDPPSLPATFGVFAATWYRTKVQTRCVERRFQTEPCGRQKPSESTRVTTVSPTRWQRLAVERPTLELKGHPRAVAQELGDLVK